MKTVCTHNGRLREIGCDHDNEIREIKGTMAVVVESMKIIAKGEVEDPIAHARLILKLIGAWPKERDEWVERRVGEGGAVSAERGAAAEAEIERLQRALGRYGTHESPCPAGIERFKSCTCGLSAALAKGEP